MVYFLPFPCDVTDVPATRHCSLADHVPSLHSLVWRSVCQLCSLSKIFQWCCVSNPKHRPTLVHLMQRQESKFLALYNPNHGNDHPHTVASHSSLLSMSLPLPTKTELSWILTLKSTVKKSKYDYRTCPRISFFSLKKFVATWIMIPKACLSQQHLPEDVVPLWRMAASRACVVKKYMGYMALLSLVSSGAREKGREE